ncbi:MAG: FAD-dependent monooxygenase [Myxococcota bacterium]
MAPSQKILIAGGGIGGCAAAHALRRRGFMVEVFERSPEIKEVGAGLSLWPNATRVLRLLGLGHIVERLAGPFVDSAIFTARGDLVTRNPATIFNDRYGDPLILVHRAELLDALIDVLGPDVVRTGARCEGFAQDREGVTLRLVGGEEVRGDLLIGADGIRSAVRRELGLPTRTRYAGYTSWRGIMRLADSGLDVDDDFWGYYLGEGKQVGISALSGGRVYWFATKNTKPGGHGSPDGHKSDLLALLTHWPKAVRRIVGATPADVVMRNDIIDLKPVKRWGEGRVTLLGDAAHAATPNMGQGACMALEDALILAQCLSGSSDLVAGLRDYESRRIARANRIVARSWWTGKLFQLDSRVLCWLRDRFVLRAPIDQRLEQLDWLLAEPFVEAKSIGAAMGVSP